MPLFPNRELSLRTSVLARNLRLKFSFQNSTNKTCSTAGISRTDLALYQNCLTQISALDYDLVPSSASKRVVPKCTLRWRLASQLEFCIRLLGCEIMLKTKFLEPRSAFVKLCHPSAFKMLAIQCLSRVRSVSCNVCVTGILLYTARSENQYTRCNGSSGMQSLLVFAARGGAVLHKWKDCQMS